MENATSSTPRATACYAVRVLRNAVASDGTEDFERYMQLPFVPAVGMLLGFDSYDDSVSVIEVAYIISLERFEIVLDTYSDDRDTIENIVTEFVKDGWAIVKA